MFPGPRLETSRTKDREQDPITLSLLDRLTTDSLQPHSGRGDRMRELKASLCRDLTGLLNTRRAEQDFDSAYEESANSILTFGIMDFTAFNLRNRIDQETVRLSIERSIRRFEPRLTNVSVTVEDTDPARPMLRFEISAVIRINSYSEDVRFNAALYRDSRRVSVSGGNA
jgi:type VI secretion system protein ImpF